MTTRDCVNPVPLIHPVLQLALRPPPVLAQVIWTPRWCSIVELSTSSTRGEGCVLPPTRDVYEGAQVLIKLRHENRRRFATRRVVRRPTRRSQAHPRPLRRPRFSEKDGNHTDLVSSDGSDTEGDDTSFRKAWLTKRQTSEWKDCGKCKFCLNKPRQGGNGRWKRACIHKQ